MQAAREMPEDRRRRLAVRLQEVQGRIDAAARRAGRRGVDVQLVAVTKELPWTCVEEAWACGLTRFGENRPEALAERLRRQQDAPMQPGWHLIGSLQSRKIKFVPADIALVHSVARAKTGALLARLGARAQRRIPVLLQVNPVGDPSKRGVALEDAEALAQALAPLSGLALQGLMAMMPLQADERTLRRGFAATRQTLEALRRALPDSPWRHLSMGMSQDFEIAVEEGATIVRVGTSLFGPRPAG